MLAFAKQKARQFSTNYGTGTEKFCILRVNVLCVCLALSVMKYIRRELAGWKFAHLIFILVLTCINLTVEFPDPGQWSANFYKVKAAMFGAHKPLYANSSIHVSVDCESHSAHQQLELQWVIRQTSCYEDYLASDIYTDDVLKQYFVCPITSSASPNIHFYISEPVNLECSNRIHLEYVNATFFTYAEKLNPLPDCQFTTTINEVGKVDILSNVSEKILFQKNNTSKLKNAWKKYIPENVFLKKDEASKDGFTVAAAHFINSNITVFQENSRMFFYGPRSYSAKLGPKLTTVEMDGVYLFMIKIESIDQTSFNATVDVSMKGNHGYLSAVDYPLLIFYGIMCGLYVIYAVIWLILSALQWRDLLRIQFWIGAVILLGLMEKAVFYAEYQSINYSGQSVQGAILFAEILSAMKRTLARMLIIIVSLGFGIVKPRLGPTLHHIVGVGFIYFIFSAIEGTLRVLKPKTDPGNQALMAGIPLAITDSIICWWIFSSLVQTIRTLRLRRNIVKLQLYRHFTNTLLLSVIGSIAFMVWSIHAHKLINCITDWKQLWVDEAYWHLLFSIILFVIMILWRPTNNNQRYAFTPLLDAIDDDVYEEDNLVTNEGFVGMKMRSTKNSNIIFKIDESKSKQDEDLKWVEENIPPSLTDVALPSLLDSDEEIMTAKFERSKME